MSVETPKKKSFSLTDLLKGKKGREVAEQIEEGTKERAPWYSYQMRPASARQLRRIKTRDARSAARRHRRAQVQDWRAAQRDAERRAVAAIRETESELGLPAGGFAEHLIAEGLLENTAARPAPGTHLETRQRVDAKGHFELVDVEVQNTRVVPVGVTAIAVAEAATRFGDGAEL